MKVGAAGSSETSVPTTSKGRRGPVQRCEGAGLSNPARPPRGRDRVRAQRHDIGQGRREVVARTINPVRRHQPDPAPKYIRSVTSRVSETASPPTPQSLGFDQQGKNKHLAGGIRVSPGAHGAWPRNLTRAPGPAPRTSARQFFPWTLGRRSQLVLQAPPPATQRNHGEKASSFPDGRRPRRDE